VKLNHVLKVNGHLRKYDDPVVTSVVDYIITNEDNVDYVTFTLPKIITTDPIPVDNIHISYDGHRLEVMGTADSKPVFLMVLSDEAMKQITTRWLTKI